MKPGDRIRRTFSDDSTDEKIIKDEREVEYYQSLEREGIKIEIIETN